jgi:hypothetical protein
MHTKPRNTIDSGERSTMGKLRIGWRVEARTKGWTIMKVDDHSCEPSGMTVTNISCTVANLSGEYSPCKFRLSTLPRSVSCTYTLSPNNSVLPAGNVVQWSHCNIDSLHELVSSKHCRECHSDWLVYERVCPFNDQRLACWWHSHMTWTMAITEQKEHIANNKKHLPGVWAFPLNSTQSTLHVLGGLEGVWVSRCSHESTCLYKDPSTSL